MATFTVTDPTTGKTVTLTSEDNTPPTEKEIEDVFSSLDSSSSSESTMSEASFDTSVIPEVKQKTAMQHVIEPVQDIAIELVRGAEEQMAGSIGKIDAVAKLVSNKTGLDITDKFKVAQDYWKQQASLLPETELPGIVKAASNIIGSSPGTLAEFVGTGGLGSMVIRAGILGALDDYGKDATDASLITGATKGAAVMGATGVAFNLAGKGLQAASEALQNYGPTAAKAVLKLSMPKNSTTDDLNKAYEKLEEITSKAFRKQGTTQEIKERAQFEIDNYKKEAEERVYLLKQEEKTAQAYKELEAKKQFDKVNDDFAQLRESLKSENADKIAKAQNKYAESVAINKEKMLDEVSSLTLSLEKKASFMEKEARDLVSKGIKDISKNTPGVGVALNEVLLPRLEKTIRNIQRDNPQIFSVSKKGKELILTPERKDVSEVVNKMAQEIKSIRENFSKSRIVPLKSLQAGKQAYQDLSKMAEDMRDNFGARAYSELSRAFNPVNYADVATGANDALRMLGAANKKFSLQADSLRLLKSSLIDNNGKSSVDTLLRSFKGDTASKRALIAALKKAESVLPESDRILSKLKNIATRASETDAKYKSILSESKEFIKKKERDLVKRQSEAVRRLRYKQGELSIEENARLSDTLRDISEKEKNIIDGIKKQLDERIRLSETVDSLQSLRQQDENSILRIMQNFGSYGVIGSVLAGNFTGALLPAAIGGALSPRMITGTAKNIKAASQNLPKGLKKTGEAIEKSDVLKKLISQSLS